MASSLTSACTGPVPAGFARQHGPVMRGVIALGKARRILQGESPCRVRASHPPVSSVASVEESRERRTK
ncbi:MAG: hypothetical protein ACREYE_27940, partial [Gammaproteobacteria bacterium]